MRMLDQAPGLAACPLRAGATRQDPRPYFLIPIRHHVYTGDTALHAAAAAHHRGLAETLVAQGAPVRARNRRGAEPLHYAADGRTGPDYPDSNAQREVIFYLIAAGADPDATDKTVSAAASSRKDPKLGRGQRPHRGWCRSAADEQERFDPPAPGCPKYRQEQLWVGSGQGGTAPDHRIATRTRCEPYRSRRKGQDRRGRRIERFDPSTARQLLIGLAGGPATPREPDPGLPSSAGAAICTRRRLMHQSMTTRPIRRSDRHEQCVVSRIGSDICA